MNLRKGFFNLTWVVSIVASLLCFLSVISYFNLQNWSMWNLILSLCVPFVVVWAIYYIIRFVIKGFTDKSGD